MSDISDLPTVTVLGVRIHPVDVRRAVETVGALLDVGQAGYVVTINPEIVVVAQRNRRFREVLNSSDLATVDGVGIALALRWLQSLRATRVTGADLLPELARLAATRGVPVFLLGAAPGVAELAALRLREQAPGLLVAGTYAGSPDPLHDTGIIGRVRSGGTRLLFVAYGAPAQELWIARNLPQLGPCVAVGVGGSLDFIAGTTPRAPRWVRRAGLEWMYRLLRQPWRWSRQLALPVFVYLAVGEAISAKRESSRVRRG